MTGFYPENVHDKQDLFAPPYFYYSQLIKAHVNPRDQDLTVVYGDLRYNSNIAILLMQTNAAKAYLPARNKGTLEEAQAALESWDFEEIRTRAEGLARPVNAPLSLGGFTQQVAYGKNFAKAVVNELKGLGLKKEDVHVSRDEKGRLVFKFPWGYPGTQEKKIRTIIFSDTDLIDEGERKSFIQTLAGETIHLYYEHPGQINLSGESLEAKNEYPALLADMANLLPPDGRIVTGQYDSWGGRIEDRGGNDESAGRNVLAQSFVPEDLSRSAQWWSRGIPEAHRLGFGGNTRIFKRSGGAVVSPETARPSLEQILPHREQPLRFAGDTRIDFKAVPDTNYFLAYVKQLTEGAKYLKAFVDAVNYPGEVLNADANGRIANDPDQLIQEAFDHIVRIRQGEEQANRGRKELGFDSKNDFNDLSRPENLVAMMSYLAFGEVLPWDNADDTLKGRLQKAQSLARLFDEALPPTEDVENAALQTIAYKDSKRARGILLETVAVFALIEEMILDFESKGEGTDKSLTFDQFIQAVQNELKEIKETWGNKPRALARTEDKKGRKRLRRTQQEESLVHILIEDDLKGIKQLAERALNMAFGYRPQDQGTVVTLPRSEVRSIVNEGLPETYPGRDIFSAKNILEGTPLWEKLKEFNHGKYPAVINVSAQSTKAAKESFDRQVQHLDKKEIVYVYFQIENKGRITHLVNVDEVQAIDSENPAPLGRHPFVLAWIEDSIAQNLHFTRVSLGKNDSGQANDPLRGQGLMKPVFGRMESLIKSRFQGWTISSLALDESGSVQKFLSHFSGVRHITTAQEVLLDDRGYEKISEGDPQRWGKFVMGRIAAGRDRLDQPAAYGEDNKQLENFLNERISEIQARLAHLREDVQHRLAVLQANWDQERSDAPRKASRVISAMIDLMRGDPARVLMLEDIERDHQRKGLDYGQEQTRHLEKALLGRIEYKQKIIKNSIVSPVIVLERQLHFFEAALRSLQGGEDAAGASFKAEQNAERLFDKLAETGYVGAWNFELRAKDKTGREVERWSEAETLVLEVRLKTDVVGQIALDRTQLQLAGDIYKVLGEKLASLKPADLTGAQESFRAFFLKDLAQLSQSESADITRNTRDREEIAFDMASRVLVGFSKKIVLIDLEKSSERNLRAAEGERPTLDALLDAQVTGYLKEFGLYGTVDFALDGLKIGLRPRINLWVEVGVDRAEFENQLSRDEAFFTYRKEKKTLNDILVFLLFHSDGSPRAETEREALLEYTMQRIADLQSKKIAEPAARRSEVRTAQPSTASDVSISNIPEGSRRIVKDGKTLFITPQADREMQRLDQLVAERSIAAEFFGFGLTKQVEDAAVVIDFVVPEAVYDFESLFFDQYLSPLRNALAQSKNLKLALREDNVALISDDEKYTFVLKVIGNEAAGWASIRSHIEKLTGKDLPEDVTQLKDLLKTDSIAVNTNWDMVTSVSGLILTEHFVNRANQRAEELGAAVGFTMHHHPQVSLAVLVMSEKPLDKRRLYFNDLLRPSSDDLTTMKRLGVDWFEIRALGTPEDMASRSKITSAFYSIAEVDRLGQPAKEVIGKLLAPEAQQILPQTMTALVIQFLKSTANLSDAGYDVQEVIKYLAGKEIVLRYQRELDDNKNIRSIRDLVLSAIFSKEPLSAVNDLTPEVLALHVELKTFDLYQRVLAANLQSPEDRQVLLDIDFWHLPREKNVTKIRDNVSRLQQLLTSSSPSSIAESSGPAEQTSSRSEVREAAANLDELKVTAETLGKFAASGKISSQEFWENVALKLEQMEKSGASLDEMTRFIRRKVHAYVESYRSETKTVDADTVDLLADMLTNVIKAAFENRSEGGVAIGWAVGSQDGPSRLSAVLNMIARFGQTGALERVVFAGERGARQAVNSAVQRHNDLGNVKLTSMPALNRGLDAFLATQMVLPAMHGTEDLKGIADIVLGVGLRPDLGAEPSEADLALIEMAQTMVQITVAILLAQQVDAPGKVITPEFLKASLLDKILDVKTFRLSEQTVNGLLQLDSKGRLVVSQNGVFNLLRAMQTAIAARQAAAKAA